MVTEPDPLPVPRTPIRDPLMLAANPDPLSACSTLTSLSQSSNSPSRSYSSNLEHNGISGGSREEKLNFDGDATLNTTNSPRNEFGLPKEAGDPLNNLLTDKKTLPSTVTLVLDDNPSFLRETELQPASVQPGSQRREDAVDRTFSEQEILIQDSGKFRDKSCNYY
jgi:hypothetical protein